MLPILLVLGHMFLRESRGTVSFRVIVSICSGWNRRSLYDSLCLCLSVRLTGAACHVPVFFYYSFWNQAEASGLRMITSHRVPMTKMKALPDLL